MKKIILVVILLSITVMVGLPGVAAAIALCPSQIVTCNTNCTINDFFNMLGNVYQFIVGCIAAPLAVIAIIIASIVLMISAGNPNLMATGKKILWAAIIGLVLAFCSYLIINFILCTILGFCSWTNPF